MSAVTLILQTLVKFSQNIEKIRKTIRIGTTINKTARKTLKIAFKIENC